MQRVDGAYIYELGAKLRAATALKAGMRAFDAYVILSAAADAVDEFINNSIFAVRSSRIPATRLIPQLRSLAQVMRDKPDWEDLIEFREIYPVTDICKEFEAVLVAELQTLSLYFASPKGSYDTDRLIVSGHDAFPSDLALKVITAVPDVQSAGRCIAFDLPTAAGFHLHRAHETVLRSYYTVVSGAAKHPKNKNMGEYIKQMEENSWGSAIVLQALKAVKDFHRNPLIHDPAFVLKSVDEAIDLLCVVRASVGFMLREMPPLDNDPTFPSMNLNL